MSRTSRALVVIAAAGLLVAACTTKNTERPSLAGPSELALSLALSASPDILTQDGSAQSRVVILARDQNGAAVKGLPLHLEAILGSTSGYGKLSSQDITTGNDGRATVTYTPPGATSTADAGTTVTIRATPVGTDYANQTPRSVEIRLVPPGYVATAPIASFTYSPAAPVPNMAVSFDASGSRCDSAAITDYSWDFGDYQTSTGKTPQHTYRASGTFTVKLQVWDEKGRASETVSQVLSVAPPQPPTANFVMSPTSIAPNQTLYLNGSSSTAGTGRTISTYAWDFGNGSTGRGMTTTTSYTANGSYTIVLVVTDDVGQTSTKSSTVNVSAATTSAPPTPNFVFSPTAPSTGQSILFDGSTSTAASGHSITSWAWTFGDGSTGTGRICTKSGGYSTAATYNVVLTVTDDTGQSASKATAVAIGGGGSTTPTPPTAAFTFSPAAPGVNESVFFDASTSAAATGHSITSYSWAFGDGSTVATGLTTYHVYTQAATYTVVLTVTDDLGQTKSASGTVVVGTVPAIPTANFAVSPSPGAAGSAIYVDASTSTTSLGQTITNYDWNFGDSTTRYSGATYKNYSHTYATAGAYTITLIVTDSIGRTATTTKSITIN